jgi:hypothetical protein
LSGVFVHFHAPFKTVEENIFEMPTGGAAIMKQGPNLVYFARKNNV